MYKKKSFQVGENEGGSRIGTRDGGERMEQRPATQGKKTTKFGGGRCVVMSWICITHRIPRRWSRM
eukprot:768624-Hanusia_phi.AAC.15